MHNLLVEQMLFVADQQQTRDKILSDRGILVLPSFHAAIRRWPLLK